MLFKDKIIAAIKAKYPAINLSKKRLDAIAAKIEEKVIDDETKIDAAIDTYNDYNPIADIAKQDDIQRNLEAKVKAATPKKEEKTEPVKPATEEVVDDGTPAWAKALIEQNKTLATGLAALQGEKVASTMRAKATEKLKEIPASFWAKATLPQKEEDLDAFVTEVQTDYTAFTQELTNKGLAQFQTPAAGAAAAGGAGGAAGTASKTVSPEVKAYAEQQQKQREQQAKSKTA